MPPLPVISGANLIRFLQRLGYSKLRQRGSHVRMVLRNDRGQWHETVPLHSEVHRGTLRSILRNVNRATQISHDELICMLNE